MPGGEDFPIDALTDGRADVAHVVALADIDAVVAEDVVGRVDVEILAVTPPRSGRGRVYELSGQRTCAASANMAPCGSRQRMVHPPPGVAIGPSTI
jgi:hypothetical protein